MKVLFVTSWYPRPKSKTSGIFFQQIADALSDYVDEVVVANVEVKFIGKIDKIGLDVRKYNKITEYMWFVPTLIPRFRPLYDWSGKRYMSKLIEKIVEKHGPFDVIHIQSAFSAAIRIKPYLDKYDIPVVYTEHSSKLLRDALNPTEKETLKWLDKRAATKIAVSEHLAEKLRVYMSDVDVIGNMLDIEPKSPNPDKFTFVCLGTLRKAKGMDLLIRAFVKEFGEDEDVRLIIGGEGEYGNELERLVAADGGKHDISLVGAVAHDKVSDFYSRGNCFVLPSDYETFGIVYIEAMACGLPVIATRCGGPEETVDESNGILIDVGSEEQLCKALRRMYIHSGDYDSEKISKDIMDKYGKRRICDSYNAIYKKITGRE